MRPLEEGLQHLRDLNAQYLSRPGVHARARSFYLACPAPAPDVTSRAVVPLAASARGRNTPGQRIFDRRARHRRGDRAEGGECSHRGLLQLLGLSLCTVSVTKQSSPSGHLM